MKAANRWAITFVPVAVANIFFAAIARARRVRKVAEEAQRGEGSA
jgi:hypothetical protein